MNLFYLNAHCVYVINPNSNVQVFYILNEYFVFVELFYFF